MPRSSTASVSLQPDHASEHPVDLCHVLDTCAESDKAIWELLQQMGLVWISSRQHRTTLTVRRGKQCSWKNSPANVPSAIKNATAKVRTACDDCVDSPGHPLLPRTTQLAIDNPPTDQQVQNWKAMCQMGCDAVIACQTLDDKLTPDLAHLATEQTFVIQSAKVKSAADAVASLLALGVRREAIARSLSAVIVLRQAQCLCQYCRTSAVPDDEATHWLAEYSPIKPSDINEWLRHRMRSSFSQASGCNRCGNSGIGNALEIYDIVPLDDTVRDALYDSDVRFALSYLQEKTSLSAQLLRLAQEGIISLNEAMRLVQPTPIEPYT